MMAVRGLLTGALLWCTSASAFNFSFIDGRLTTCQNSTVRWYGGTPPFSLTLVPLFNFPTNISIPDSAWDEEYGIGSYSYNCDYSSGREIVAFMSDATGLATGGVSEAIKVTDGGINCPPRIDNSSFRFYLDETALTQCESVNIYWDTTAVDPVNIIGVIPGGQAVQIPGSGKTSIDWIVNVPAGTTIIMTAFDDSLLGQGGSGQALTVQESNDNSCLGPLSPTSIVPGSPSQTRAPVVTVTTTELAGSRGKPISTGAIIGIAVGFFIMLQAALYWFCCRKPLAAYREQRKHRALQDLDDQQRVRPLNLIDSRTTAEASDRGDDVLPSLDDDQPSVSPFWDGAAVGYKNRQYPSDGGVASSENLISPTLQQPQHPYPPRAAVRTDNSSPSTPLSAVSPSYPPITTSYDRSRSHTPDLPLASIMASALSSREQSKMQLLPVNPDPGFEGDALPLPRGGFRRHRDGGPMPAPRRQTREADEVLELPPLYDELWSPDQGGSRDAATDRQTNGR